MSHNSASSHANNLQSWWDAIYPHAITLEKKITLSPVEYSPADAPSIIAELDTVHVMITNTPHPEDATMMREHLIRATYYLKLAYEELEQDTEEEIEFYYSSALLQVAQLHTLLVHFGFTQ